MCARTPPTSTTHRYRFARQGGELRVLIQTFRDLAALTDLDETSWLATSAPVDAFSCDPAFLKHLDGDGDGRIRSADIKEAIRWLERVLRSTAGVDERAEHLDLDRLAESDPEARRLGACARRIGTNLGDRGGRLSLQQVRDRAHILAQGDQNGDGIVPPEYLREPDLKALCLDVMSTVGSVRDMNGSPGVSEELLDMFLAEARDHLAWSERVSASIGEGAPLDPWRVVSHGLPLLHELGPRLERYFDLCDALSFATEIGAAPASASGAAPPSADPAAFLEQAPLARPRPDGALDLGASVNPAARRALVRLKVELLDRLPGPGYEGSLLSRDGWERVRDVLERVRDAHEARKGERVSSLGVPALSAMLASGTAERLRRLLRMDGEAGSELSSLRELEFVILAQRWMLELANNFAALPALGTAESRTLLDAGRLVLDGQVFDFVMRVRDPAAHAAVAKRSGIFLFYSEVTTGAGGERFHIVTPVIGRRTADVYPEKRGVFFDLAGGDFDARVVHVIENPTTLGEAVAAPFRRIAALVASAAEKISSGAEKQIEATVSQATAAVPGRVLQAPPAAGTPAPAAAPAGVARVRDAVLTGGVTIAALGSSVAFVAKTISEMNWRGILISAGAVLVLVMVPNVLMAAGKLRRRDLSLLLEAAGWATNGKIRVSRRLRGVFSPRPPVPGERTSRR